MLIIQLLLNMALADTPCIGTKEEINEQTATIESEIAKGDSNASGFQFAAVTTKEGNRFVYTYVTTTAQGRVVRMAGTDLYGGPNCTQQESFSSIVRRPPHPLTHP